MRVRDNGYCVVLNDLYPCLCKPSNEFSPRALAFWAWADLPRYSDGSRFGLLKPLPAFAPTGSALVDRVPSDAVRVLPARVEGANGVVSPVRIPQAAATDQRAREPREEVRGYGVVEVVTERAHRGAVRPARLLGWPCVSLRSPEPRRVSGARRISVAGSASRFLFGRPWLLGEKLRSQKPLDRIINHQAVASPPGVSNAPSANAESTGYIEASGPFLDARGI